jgi:hypothetical protein
VFWSWIGNANNFLWKYKKNEKKTKKQGWKNNIWTGALLKRSFIWRSPSGCQEWLALVKWWYSFMRRGGESMVLFFSPLLFLSACLLESIVRTVHLHLWNEMRWSGFIYPVYRWSCTPINIWPSLELSGLLNLRLSSACTLNSRTICLFPFVASLCLASCLVDVNLCDCDHVVIRHPFQMVSLVPFWCFSSLNYEKLTFVCAGLFVLVRGALMVDSVLNSQLKGSAPH